ncbi:MAG: GNAT family N-acetyltransferase [Bacteroidia bacterium]|nr:GNAT family N-acetyltransferase [Bacteroidia bacterium]
MLDTERLTLIALPEEHLRYLSAGYLKLEQYLGLRPSGFHMPPGFGEMFAEALPHILESLAADPGAYPWSTHWMIVHTGTQTAIGGIGLGGPPDDTGRTVVGYFVDTRYHNRGFASEALRRLLVWAFDQPNLLAVRAETLPEGVTSQRVLIRNGFNLIGNTSEGNLIWEKLRPDPTLIP